MRKRHYEKNYSINMLAISSAILIVAFYLLPLLFKGSIASLFLINPLAVLLCSIIYGKNHKFDFVIVMITIILFFPTIFIFYNESAWVYVVLYAAISIIGSYIGSILNN